LECAMEIAAAIKSQPQIRLRIGIHSGPVNQVIDVSGRPNVTGAGIDVAQRVMDCGDDGHILLSKRIAEDLAPFPRWNPHLHELGECEVKHGRRISLVNFYTDEIGNPRLPQKVQQARTQREAALFTSLAVLPLESETNDSEEEYFGDGMTEALITNLAKIGALRVISRASVMRYKGARRPSPEIARELGVNAVLTGSSTRANDRVRIAVQLTDAATERSLWSETYDRPLAGVLELQRDVARDIADEIRIKLTPQEQLRFGKVRPVNAQAYDNYLRGKFYLHRQTRDCNETAINSLQQAVAADPTFAAAHAELAQAYLWKLFLFAPNETEWAEKAFIEAEKALQLDSDLAVAYLARGRTLWTPANHFPHEAAIRDYRRALQLNPALDEARNQLALVYCHVGLLEEALRESRKAIATDPNNYLAQYRIGETLNFQCKNEEALTALCAIPRDANPALVGHQIVWALYNLARNEEASATAERYLKDFPDDYGGLFTSLEAILAAANEDDEWAERKIAQAVERGKGFGHFHHTAYHIGCAYAVMKKTEQAIKFLVWAAEDGFPCYPLFQNDPNLNSIREDARFVALLAKLKQQWEHYRSLV
ncbi:MAG TPA: adenylate/guanylate cyclase domain-containing protein, partial [Candidatus Binataceae bacterium]|nr:adenylate/guanylate cyclase domain-containing protein [Candidatus Binataceae bacterium]